jgi:hypothetical protein
MGLFSHKSNEEAAYQGGQDRAETALQKNQVAEHEQLLTDLNAHPEYLRGFRDRVARG